MKRFVNFNRAKFLKALAVLAMAVFVGDGPDAATPRIDESQLTALGFKVLVATTKVQQDWVRTLPPGQIKAMQRNGKKFFVYPDASKSQIYVGGPAEYDAYVKAHPEEKQRVQSAQDAAAKTNAERVKQGTAMQAATNSRLVESVSGRELGRFWLLGLRPIRQRTVRSSPAWIASELPTSSIAPPPATSVRRSASPA